MASSEGGMDIEAVAAATPEKIHRVFIDPASGLTDADADDVARKIGIPGGERAAGRARCCRASTARSTKRTLRWRRSIR